MAKLLKLPTELANLIRSGVVAPTFVRCVEELVLNSIDAEATKVSIKINFEDYNLQVEDNGCGIEKEDLELVGERYYTSKAHTKNDLNNLQTYGYRGEALTSLIDCSSAVEIFTKTNFKSHVYVKKFKNGEASSVRRGPAGKVNNRGCVVTVRGMLSRCPVRQSKLDKKLQIQELLQMVEHLNLINPKLSIILRDDRTAGTLFESVPARSLQDALGRMYKKRSGLRHHEHLMELRDYTDFIEIASIISKDSHHNRHMQFLFVNRRFIPKSRIYKLLEEQLSSVLGFGIRQSTSSKDSQDFCDPRNVKKNSPKPGSNTAETYPVFIINITCPWTECMLTIEDNKNKVTFHNLHTLSAAIQTFATKFKRVFQPSHKLAPPPRVGAALMRNNSMDPKDRSSSNEREVLTARKVCERLTVHDMKGSVLSKPAIRARNDRELKLSQNKPLAETKDTDDESDSPIIRCDESDDSSEHHVPFENYLPEFTKSRLQDKKKPTSRLNRTHTHDIRKLKKRKQARESSTQANEIEVHQKKSRLTVPSQIFNKNWRNSSDRSQRQPSATSFSPEVDVVFMSSQTEVNDSHTLRDSHNSDSDVEFCDKMSVLSVSTKSQYPESAPKTDSRTRFEPPRQERKLSAPLSAYETVLPVVGPLNQRVGIPDYAVCMSKHISDRFHVNSRRSEFSYTSPQQLQQLFAGSAPAASKDFVTPENNRLRPHHPVAHLAIASKKPLQLEGKLYGRQTAGKNRGAVSSGTDGLNQNSVAVTELSKPIYVAAISRHQDNKASTYFSQDLHFDHQDGLAGVTLRSRAGESKSSSVKSEKRYGRVFNSQDFPVGVVNPDSPMGEIQGDFTPVQPEPTYSSNTGEYNDPRVGFWVQNVVPVGVGDERTPSAIMNLRNHGGHTDWNNTDSSNVKPRRRSNDGRSNGKDSSLCSSVEEYSQNMASFSQQFPEYRRPDHVREPIGALDFEENGESNFSKNNNHHLNDNHNFRRRDFESNAKRCNVHGFTDVQPEVPRQQRVAHYSFVVDESLLEFPTYQETSKYFQRNSVLEEAALDINPWPPEPSDGINLINSLGHIPMTPVAEKRLPEIKSMDEVLFTACNGIENTSENDLIPPLIEKEIHEEIGTNNVMNPDEEQDRTQEETNDTLASPLTITEISGFLAVGEESVVHSTEEKIMTEKDCLETILLNKQSSPNFRNAWLKKVFPEGAKKDWKWDDTFYKKVQPVSNLDQLNQMDSRLAETVISCFAEAYDDDLIMDKWDATSWIAATSAPRTSIEDFNSHKPAFPAGMPLDNMKSREIQLWSMKSIQDPQISCRFTKQDLARTLVIGQVDGKFIAAKISVDSTSAENCKKQILVLFDQHAVHERIRLEKLISESLEEVEGVKGIASVDISPPMLMNFADTEVSVMNNFKTSFASIGVTLEVSGPHAVKIFSAPKCFVKKISHMVRASRQEAIEQLVRSEIQEHVQNIIQTNGSPQPIPKIVMEVLKSAACKGAYKFGDQLSVESCIELMENLTSCKAPFQCAHGRPVLVPLLNL
ncbi:unnamed protein product [Allacma fusca]|uniref:Uncharacterized protein n=1 Tax=Allacma fusca TaxID=39272 RepID=A0A8J2NU09_9HEXA|nr:unnamed protein product [Allacma fusca]